MNSRPLDTRAAAACVIGKLLEQQGSLASLLPEYSSKVAPNEHSLLQELCYGTARWQPRLQLILNALLEKPLRSKDADVQGLLLVGLYQLLFMRVPDHAALNSTVGATQALKKPWAKGLTNGLLREFLRERAAIETRLQQDAQWQSAHPAWLMGKIIKAWPTQAAEIFIANNQHAPLTLRVNRQQISRDAYLELLASESIAALPTAYSGDGVMLTTATAVTGLPLFHQGGFSVQDEAPQLAAQLLDVQPQQRVLDACCAPGGKTSHILELQPALGHLLGLDVSEARLQRTRDNIERLQLVKKHAADTPLPKSEPQLSLRAGDAGQPKDWWDGQAFDRILLDAPCSATGIIRRQPDIKILRTPEQVTKLVGVQAALLDALWPTLQAGGKLLYATCSILPEENETQVSRFLARTPNAVVQPLVAEWGIATACGRQLLPQHREGGPSHDGFYYALLQKQPE